MPRPIDESGPAQPSPFAAAASDPSENAQRMPDVRSATDVLPEDTTVSYWSRLAPALATKRTVMPENVFADGSEDEADVVALHGEVARVGGDRLHQGREVELGRAIGQVLERDRQRRDERRDNLRGCIRFCDQVARGGGVAIPLEISYADYTADVLENRMLVTAATLGRAASRFAWKSSYADRAATST